MIWIIFCFIKDYCLVVGALELKRNTKKAEIRRASEVINVLTRFGLMNNDDIECQLCAYGNDKDIRVFTSFFNNGEFGIFEAPDAYMILDDNVMIIEHFTVDSGYNNKKGSNTIMQLKSVESFIDEENGVSSISKKILVH